ncbi:MAG TPA: hypothetical protein VHW02_14615 [Rhizomicrobium sp.]|jgi:hypothetical protein|nr:hypothetical protein [Rhizomicrobium sp.]
MKTARELGMVLACAVMAASTNAIAADAGGVSASAVSTQSSNVQVAAVEPTSAIASQTATTADPLHTDARWPLFKNCIDNTSNRNAFEACLQMAFLGGSPSPQVLALLTR